MKYNSLVPLSGLFLYLLIILLIYLGILPESSNFFESLNNNYSYLILFFVILIESILYLGFYFPGQLIAVFLVAYSGGNFLDFLVLLFISIFAVTIAAAINYFLGYLTSNEKINYNKKINYKELLLAMIHINILALYIYKKGREKSSKKVILLAGLLNIPYYLLMILVIYFFQDQILGFVDNSYFLGIFLLIWFVFSLRNDIKNKISH
jgi:membrane-associated protein